MDGALKAVGLPNRGVVAVGGEDARAFLDNLITNSMADVAPGKAVHAALLTPQGKIITDFFVVEAPAEDGGGFYCDVPLVAAAELAKRLTFYRLRARVTVRDMSEELAVVALWCGEIEVDGLDLAYSDPRLTALGYRAIVHRSQILAATDALGAKTVSLQEFHAFRARIGVGEVAFDYTQGDAFPHEINMDQLNGIDFRKGCYVGQEVVSRMQHRGSARTRLVQLHYKDGFVATEGSQVLAADKLLGQTGTAADGIGIAMLRLDRVADAIAAGVPILAGGLAVTIVKSEWWNADWPLSG